MLILPSPEVKKAFMLFKALIFHYHGLDDEEAKILEDTAEMLQAHDELEWAYDFISHDYLSAFDRSREYLNKTIGRLKMEDKLQYMLSVWDDNYKKGYLTEMEATAMLNLSKDWGIEKDLLKNVRQ